MNDTIVDHATLITALGGAARLASPLDTLPVTVRAWAARKRIPAEYWPSVIEFASSVNISVTADWLMRTTPPRAGRSAPTEMEALVQ